MFRIDVVRSAVKELEKLESNIFEKVALSIDRLSENPRPGGVKKTERV